MIPDNLENEGDDPALVITPPPLLRATPLVTPPKDLLKGFVLLNGAVHDL